MSIVSTHPLLYPSEDTALEFRPTKASAMQEGGDHYKGLAIQPAEFIHKNNIPFLEGNVIKYVVRHNAKNGAADLLKARHYIDLLLEYQYSGK